MPETPPTSPASPEPPGPDPTPSDPPAGDPPLGPEGEKALAAWKERARSAEAEARRAKDLEAELDKLRKAAMSDSEKAITEAKAAGAAEADKRWLDRVVRAEARAAAAGKTVDPDVVVALLDLSTITVTNGEVDSAALAKAIDDIVAEKPFLRLTDAGKAPTPSAPSGPRGGANPPLDPSQMSMAEYIDARNKGLIS